MNDVTPKPEAAGASAQDRTLQEFLGVPPATGFRRWRKWIIIGAIALVALLLIWRFWGGEEATTYATADVERGNLTVTVSATGNLQPTNQVQVGSEQSGLVTDVYVDNNDQVTKGQPLARLDTSRLRDTITQNEASVASAQASVAQAEASAVNARASLNRLEEVYRLSGGKVPSKAELDSARAENLRAIAGVRAAQAQVAQARAQLSSSNTNLAKATIYSPVNGVVLSRQIDEGQTVAASLNAPVLFTIAEDLSSMKLEVKVDEADIGQVKEGQRATFTVDAQPGRTYPAQISRIDVGSSASATTGAQGNANTVVSYISELAVQNADFSLRPGMTATADIVTMQRCNVLLVPNSALRFNPTAPVAAAPVGMPGAMPMGPGAGQQRRPERQARIGRGSRQTVYILGANGQPQAVQVTVGNTNGALTEVTGGLKPGQKVITSRLSAGAQQGPGGQQGFGGQRGGGQGAAAGGMGARFGGRGPGQARCVEEGGAAAAAGPGGRFFPGQGRGPEGSSPAAGVASGAAAGAAARVGNAGPEGRRAFVAGQGGGPGGAAGRQGAGGRGNFDPNDPRVKAWRERMARGEGPPPGSRRGPRPGGPGQNGVQPQSGE